MKLVETYKEFYKIKRKYYKKHCVKRVDHFNGKRFVSYWEENDWLGYIVTSVDKYLNDKVISKEIKSLIGEELYNDTLEDVKYLYNNIFNEFKFYYKYNDIERIEYGQYIGVVITNRDSYFLIKNKNEQKLIPMWWNVEKI